MKRKNVCKKVLAVLLPLLCLFITACQGSATPTKEYYTVYYETEHGTAPEGKKVLSGTILNADDLPELTADGFTFEGWYIGSSKITPELNYTVNSNIKLTAKWTEVTTAPPEPTPTPTPASYTVSYTTDHGQTPQSKSLLSGTALTAADLPDLTAQGYVFEGWYIGTTKITPGYEVTGNITLTGKWTEEIVLCSITYVSAYGLPPQSKNVPVETILTAEDLPEIAAEGYTFSGWYIGNIKISAGYKITSNINLSAWWGTETPPPVSFTITYQSEHGTVPDSKTIESGTLLTAAELQDISCDGYRFDGWYLNNINITVDYHYQVVSNITLVAKWTPYYSISYTTAYENAPGTKTVLKGTTLTETDLPNLSHTGYSFDGWYIDQTKVTAGYTVNSNITLTAKWIPIYYTITYETQHGTAPASKNVLQGTKLTATDLPDRSFIGYSFDGWFIDQTKITAGYEVYSHITLKAKWTPIYFTITYLTDYDTGNAPASKSVLQGTALTAGNLPDLSYTGYDFDGWYIGQTRITGGYQVMDNITLVAKWTALYKITYSTAHGTAPAEKMIRADTNLSAADLAAPSYTGSDYGFEGWYNGSTKIQAGSKVSSNITLVAKWISYFTVSYTNPFGSAPQTKRVAEGTKLTAEDLPDNYTTTGYSFAGWYLDAEKITAGYEVVSNITLMANWLKTYTVTYFSERGTVPSPINVDDKTLLDANDLPTLTASGYTFAGWYVGNTKITDSYQVTGNVTLTGKWNYTISYSTAHGTTPTIKTVSSGYKLTQSDLPTLSDNSYIFIGWKIGDQTTSVNYAVNDNITLTAVWADKPSGFSLLITSDTDITEDELNFALTVQKSGDSYILTATEGYDCYVWSVDTLRDFYYEDEVRNSYSELSSGNVPANLAANTLTFTESTLPEDVAADGTYVVYVQAFRLFKENEYQSWYNYKRVGLAFTIIKM